MDRCRSNLAEVYCAGVWMAQKPLMHISNGLQQSADLTHLSCVIEHILDGVECRQMRGPTLAIRLAIPPTSIDPHSCRTARPANTD